MYVRAREATADARREQESFEAHGSGLGRIRYVVERAFFWLHAFRRLATCYERRADLHDAPLSLGCSIICWSSPHRLALILK